MKLKNIIIALSAVIAFSGCSSDNDENSAYKAKLTVKVATSKTTTKADSNELAGEANINNIATVVFNEAGTSKIGYAFATPNTSHSYTMEDVPVTETGKAKIVIVVNAPANAFESVGSYAQMQALLDQLANQKQNSLTMSTQVINTTTELNEGINYLGVSGQTNINGINTLLLTRVPARIQVERIGTNFTRGVLVGRSVQVEEIYLENVKNQSHYFSEADWGKVEIAGSFISTDIAKVNLWTSASSPIANVNYWAYVMENFGEESATRIVVKATLDAAPPYRAETKYFHVSINATGISRGLDHNNIKRNYVYALDLTFGDGSFNGDETDPDPEPEPDPTGQLDVLVTVVSWGEVTQTPDF